mmetsp:Transcript_15505/g.32738  ORF Transcript_15505/g.32738 Transcript_15505/m.32738 type:complete len:504 (-) Transcript_15505:72-1583(-)
MAGESEPCCSAALAGLAQLCPLFGRTEASGTRTSLSAKKLNFVVDNRGKIRDHYALNTDKLGAGSYGSVCKAEHKASKSQRAIKTISKAQTGKTQKAQERLEAEIDIMKSMDHPGIIKLYETFEDKQNIYLVMEICGGGELFDRIVEAGHFSETDAAIVMQQMIGSIYYMHKNNVCHRDLKPENFLFLSKEPIRKNVLKLIDFGLSAAFAPNQVFHTKAGTPYYVAPQVLSGTYDQASDLWSCGVIMYVLLCGYPPFFGDSDADVLNLVRKGSFSFNPSDWKSVSEDAKNLIRSLLKMNPSDRFTAQQALEHVWITEKAPRASNVPLGSGLVENLRSFRSTNKLKKAALHVIASQLSEERIKDLRQQFIALDVNGDGMLSVKELKEGIKKSGLTSLAPDLQQIIEDVDSDRSGVIDYTEFLAATLDTRLYLQEDVCWSAFCVFDRNGDGRISQEELKEVLKHEGVEGMLGAQTVAELMSEIDTDGNGEIDFKEFMQMMRKSGK